MKTKILVTGGAGYIGSHTTVELQNTGYEVIILDVEMPDLTGLQTAESHHTRQFVQLQYRSHQWYRTHHGYTPGF